MLYRREERAAGVAGSNGGVGGPGQESGFAAQVPAERVMTVATGGQIEDGVWHNPGQDLKGFSDHLLSRARISANLKGSVVRGSFSGSQNKA